MRTLTRSRLLKQRRFLAFLVIPAAAGFAVWLAAASGPPLVRGTLRIEAGVPNPLPPSPDWAAGVRLTFTPSQDGRTEEAVTDSLGRFSLRLPPGQYKVSASGPGVFAQPQNDFTFKHGVEIGAGPDGIITVSAGGPNVFPIVIVGP